MRLNVVKLILMLYTSLLMGSCTHSVESKSTFQEKRNVSEAMLVVHDTTWVEIIRRSKESWKALISENQYQITREHGTEPPFSHPYNNLHEKGIFYCADCQNPLFASNTKFDSGTGWPSFWKPYHSRSVKLTEDRSFGMIRNEVSCARCGAHLGHVFDDGPAPTGLRYCMNGLSLKFQKELITTKLEKAIFAQGCFWCVEEIFESLKGVKAVVSGYAGGKEVNPTYEEVGRGSTDHAEAVEVTYDPSVITYQQLLKVFFNAGDPTQVNGQGPDHGTQYRSIIFYKDAQQKNQIEAYMQELSASGRFTKPLSVQLLPQLPFYLAESYHQDYVKNHPETPYVIHVSIPRYRRAIQYFPELLKSK